ncbi:hypothetical protein Dimus_028164 [Dionaea muscipula]
MRGRTDSLSTYGTSSRPLLVRSGSLSACGISINALVQRTRKGNGYRNASLRVAVQLFLEICSNLEVDYESEEKASIIYSALVVDKELQPDKVKRQMSVSNGKLYVHFQAVEARFLRASFSAFVDVLTLATRTIEEFGPGTKL